MGEEVRPEGSSPRKVYRVSPGRAYWRWVWLGMGLLVLVGPFYAFAWCMDYFLPQGLWFPLLVVWWLLTTCLAGATLYLRHQMCMATSPEGLELFGPGYRMSTTWENLEKVGTRKWIWPGFEILHLRQKPPLHSSGPLRWLWSPISLGRPKLPLGLFQRSWQGELGQDFRRYAPHLFSAEELERPPSASASQSPSVPSKPSGTWIAGGGLATMALLVGLLVFCRSRLHTFDYYMAWGDHYVRSFIQEDQEQAIEAYTHAIELEPQRALPFNRRGIVYSAMGDKEAALADFSRAIELDPHETSGFLNAYLNRGNLYYEQGDYEAALADYERGVELDPDSAWAYYYRGNAHLALGDREVALADYTRAVELAPNNVFMRERLEEVRSEAP